MKTVDTYGSFEDAITKSAPEAQKLAGLIRELIVDVYPDVVEVAWPKQGTIGYGVGPKKMS